MPGYIKEDLIGKAAAQERSSPFYFKWVQIAPSLPGTLFRRASAPCLPWALGLSKEKREAQASAP
jgi:hypothetical protein